MDGSHFPLENYEALLDAYIDEIVEDATTDRMNQLLDILEQFDDCECGCRGARHTREIFHEVTRLRHSINITIPALTK